MSSVQYVGGKQKSGGHRIAAHIRRVSSLVSTRVVQEPMCGGLSVTARLEGLEVHASDACRPLIVLYDAVRCGWEPPAVVTRETWDRYRALRDDPESWADPMLAFVGFGCSRSGAWFSSYVEDYKYTERRVPAATAARDSLRKKLAACAEVTFSARDYEIPVLVSERRAPEGWVVVDEWGIQQRMTTGTSAGRKVERLYVHERWANQLCGSAPTNYQT